MAGDSWDISIASRKYEAFKCSANDVIHFKLVRCVHDVNDETKSFKPDMTHQIFGDSETIFGYKDLRVDIHCTAARMITFLGVKYSDKISPQEVDGLPPDNITALIGSKLQPGFFTNQDLFLAELSKEKEFRPFGTLLHVYHRTDTEGNERVFEVYRCSIADPGFVNYHERLQPLLLFYVDAAWYIDMDDDQWNFYVIYEKYNSDGNIMHAFVGYMTVYNYYSYPARFRPRISQVLILPPFQRHGHGSELLSVFYRECLKDSNVYDITVEDPNENFQRMRDILDVSNCKNLLSYSPALLVQGFTDKMFTEARNALKINKKQARRVYEILRLQVTDCSNASEYKAYRLDVKRRIFAPFQRKGREFEKLQRALRPHELATLVNNLSLDQRYEFLEKQYREAEQEYRQVLERIASK